MLQNLRNRAAEEKGFTLIELLVVILIIGILAAIALPTFLGQQKKGQDCVGQVRCAQRRLADGVVLHRQRDVRRLHRRGHARRRPASTSARSRSPARRRWLLVTATSKSGNEFIATKAGGAAVVKTAPPAASAAAPPAASGRSHDLAPTLCARAADARPRRIWRRNAAAHDLTPNPRRPAGLHDHRDDGRGHAAHGRRAGHRDARRRRQRADGRQPGPRGGDQPRPRGGRAGDPAAVRAAHADTGRSGAAGDAGPGEHRRRVDRQAPALRVHDLGQRLHDRRPHGRLRRRPRRALLRRQPADRHEHGHPGSQRRRPATRDA